MTAWGGAGTIEQGWNPPPPKIGSCNFVIRRCDGWCVINFALLSSSELKISQSVSAILSFCIVSSPPLLRHLYNLIRSRQWVHPFPSDSWRHPFSPFCTWDKDHRLNERLLTLLPSAPDPRSIDRSSARSLARSLALDSASRLKRFF